MEKDFARYLEELRARTGGEEVSRQLQPARQLRPQSEKERAPDWYQRRQEYEGSSEWSGGKWGGGSVSGTSR